MDAPVVTMEHVHTCQKRFLHRMEDEVKGYQVETCFGRTGCPNRALKADGLAGELEKRLSKRDLKTFLKSRVKGPLKMHHEFRVSVSDCPNACSRPQIVDVGLIGASRPEISDQPCSECGECVRVCREQALKLDQGSVQMDESRCLSCGQCIKVCPTGALVEGARGFRILVGGKLGRHPRLGRELSGIFDDKETIHRVERCLDLYQAHCAEGERFGEILEKTGLKKIE